jgi:hypothetical protein
MKTRNYPSATPENAPYKEKDLTDQSFEGADLTEADFTGATLTNTTWGKFEPNYSIYASKKSKHTSAYFFKSIDEIKETLDRLPQEKTDEIKTLQAIVAHSLINKLMNSNANSTEELTKHQTHDFFQDFDWATHAPSLLRNLINGRSAISTNQEKAKLCAYFLIMMPKLTKHERDILDFFLTTDKKDALIKAVETNPTLLNEETLEQNQCAYTQIINTRRHLFNTERDPNETKHSIQLHNLFKAAPKNPSTLENDQPSTRFCMQSSRD